MTHILTSLFQSNPIRSHPTELKKNTIGEPVMSAIFENGCQFVAAPNKVNASDIVVTISTHSLEVMFMKTNTIPIRNVVIYTANLKY